MSYLSFRLGRFELLAQRETESHTFRVAREGDGEVIVDLPFLSLTFTIHRPSNIDPIEFRDSL